VEPPDRAAQRPVEVGRAAENPATSLEADRWQLCCRLKTPVSGDHMVVLQVRAPFKAVVSKQSQCMVTGGVIAFGGGDDGEKGDGRGEVISYGRGDIP